MRKSTELRLPTSNLVLFLLMQMTESSFTQSCSSHQHSNTAAFNWILNWILYLSTFLVMSDSNMVFISHLSGLYACWKAEGTRGILGRLPRSAEHYKFQAFPHSPSQLIHLLLASFFLCTHYYCKIFGLERFKGKWSYVLFFMVFFFSCALMLSKNYANEVQKKILSANLLPSPTSPQLSKIFMSQ